jgi:hypothetical protein
LPNITSFPCEDINPLIFRKGKKTKRKISLFENFVLYLPGNPKFVVMQIYNTCPKSDKFRKNGILKDSTLISNKLLIFKYLFGVWMFLFLLAFGKQTTAGTKTSITAAPWGSATTWSPSGVPASGDDVILKHKVTVDADFTCHNLDIDAAGRLSVQPGFSFTISSTLTYVAGGVIELFSDASGSGSVIYNNLADASTSTIYFERYMTGTSAGVKKWHTFTAPMTNSTFTNFFETSLNGNATKVEVSSNGLYYSFGRIYNETTNKWEYPFLSNNSNDDGKFIAGKGYCVAMKANGSVKMSGNLATSPVSVPITFSTGTEPPGGFGWNTLGNPFTSAINVHDYLTANLSQLDGTYGGLYVWNPAGHYDVTSLGGGLTDLQVGQGFVTRSKVGGGTITFTYAMREHATSAAFKDATLPWPSIQLKAETQGLTRTTLVNFNSGMTVGMDPFYDAGLLRAGSNLELYTRLIDNSGNDLAIQCLPDAGFDKMVIPVSLDLTTAGEVTFSAKSLNLSDGCQPVLEDRVAGVSTPLYTEDAVYKVNLPANTSGIKRFYLHLNGITSAINSEDLLKLKVYAIGKEIHIQGDIAEQSVANLYDLSGRQIGTYQVPASDSNILNMDGIANGFYLLRIMEGNKPKYVGKIRLQ